MSGASPFDCTGLRGLFAQSAVSNSAVSVTPVVRLAPDPASHQTNALSSSYVRWRTDWLGRERIIEPALDFTRQMLGLWSGR